jgi:Thoeris protein ThsB, TIR-like domain
LADNHIQSVLMSPVEHRWAQWGEMNGALVAERLSRSATSLSLGGMSTSRGHMTKRVFISFRAEDKPQVDGLRLLAKNPNFDLEFYDESIRVPVNSQNAEYIKSVIQGKIGRAGVVLCLVSAQTHTSGWVDWELTTAINLQKPIVAMAVKDLHRAVLPGPIRGKTAFRNWCPGDLESVLEAATVVSR